MKQLEALMAKDAGHFKIESRFRSVVVTVGMNELGDCKAYLDGARIAV